jgi:hypothetical protein
MGNARNTFAALKQMQLTQRHPREPSLEFACAHEPQLDPGVTEAGPIVVRIVKDICAAFEH